MKKRCVRRVGSLYKYYAESCFFSRVSKDMYLVHAPEKPLTFVCNRSMVDFIKSLCKTGVHVHDETYRSSFQLLDKIGFFQQNKRRLPEIEENSIFKPCIGVILVTNSCNLSCIYCYATPNSAKPKIISSQTGKQLIDIVANNAISMKASSFSICFHGGGEPTIPAAQHRVLELIKYAKSKELPCNISLTTNGYWSEEDAEIYLTSGITEISLSCDGIEEIQNRQRPTIQGTESFSRVFSTIKAIEKKGMPYGIRFSVMDESITNLPESIKYFCENTACNVFQVEPVFGHGKAKESYLKNNTRFVKAFFEAYDIASTYGRTIYYSGARPAVFTNKFCSALDSALIVNQDNDLTSCYEVFGKEHELSGLFMYGKMNSEGDLMIDTKIREMLAATISLRQAECLKKRCFCYYHCAGDCPPKTVKSVASGADVFSARCKLNRSITKGLLLRNIESAGGVWHGEDTQGCCL